MNYQTYLFSCLLKMFDEHFDSLPYDEQYDMLPELYSEFELSLFNDDNTNLYDCIYMFLNNKYGSKL